MKKVTNRYRKCPNCPHHKPKEQKCCCQKSPPVRKMRAMTSRHKREPSTIQNSSAMNTTIPTIIAEFSALRTQNNHLKRQLLNVSTFLKDDNPHNQSIVDTPLSQKLFLSNKNLKEALLQVDGLSRANKELCERNSRLVEQSQGFKIQLRQAHDYLEKYKKKCKKMAKDQETLASKEQIQKILQNNADLEDQVHQLKEQIRCLKFQNNNFNMVGALSPEWVAHTGHKIKQNELQVRGDGQMSKEDISVWKKEISDTISLLRNEGNRLLGSPFDPPGLTKIDSLTEQLISSYSESVLTHFQLLMKEMNRKLNNYEKKMGNLASKLENVIIVFKNKKLKKKMSPSLPLAKTERMPMSDLTNRVL